MADGPAPPLDDWPVQLHDRRFGYVWYCPGAIVVTQITLTHGTAEAASIYMDVEEQLLSACASDVREAGGLYVVHDWRRLQTYDAAARREWQERMKERPSGYLRGSTACVERAGPLLKMAVQGANLLAAMTHGGRIELSTDMAATLKELGIERPAPGSRFPVAVAHGPA